LFKSDENKLYMLKTQLQRLGIATTDLIGLTEEECYTFINKLGMAASLESLTKKSS